MYMEEETVKTKRRGKGRKAMQCSYKHAEVAPQCTPLESEGHGFSVFRAMRYKPRTEQDTDLPAQ